MRKRILTILLVIAMLVPMEGMELYAAGNQEGQKQEMEDTSGKEEKPPETSGEEEKPPETSGEEEKPPAPPGEEEDPSEPPEEEKQEYTIYFNLAGGMTPEGESSVFMQVIEGELPDAGKVVVPVKTGYFFQGWLDGEGNYYNFDQPVTGNVSLLASWVPITYQVQFDLNGGSGENIPQRMFTYDKEEQLPADAGKKSGYVFSGWQIGESPVYEGGSYVKNLAYEQDAVVVLKAVWTAGRYKVRFDANGGTGTMNEETFTCGKSRLLYKNKYKKTGYTFEGWNSRKDGTGDFYKEREDVEFKDQENGDTVVLFAMWKANPYRVRYEGNGAESGIVLESSHVYGTSGSLNLNAYIRKGYTFAGWNTQQDGKGKTYKNGAQVKNLTDELNGTVTLYAKWTAIKYNITYNLRGGKLKSSAKTTYTIANSTFELPAPTRSGYDFDGWYKDKNLKNRVHEIKKGSTGNKTFYAKWVKCTRSPKKNSGKLTLCKATGTGKIKVSATIKNRVASDDDGYYLVYVNPINGKPYRMAKKAYKKKKISFTLKTKENQGYAVSLYGIAVKKNGAYKLISSTSYVKNLEKAAGNKSKYKLGKTKKGIQYYSSMREIDDCGAKNTFLNMTVSMIYSNAVVPYQYNGKMYYFSPLDEYRQIVSECNKKGINVTMQIMLDWTGGHTDLVHPNARAAGAAPFYAWNVYSSAPREEMEAIFCYLGSVFGKKSCYVSNWVLGNEVNNPKSWNYAGSMTEHAYFKTYAYAFRSLYCAVRSQYSNARIFICTDNFWNTSVAGGYSAKHVISSFTSHLNKMQKGLKWNLAYHAYSTPLTYTNFWDGYGITNDANTPYVTMKNLSVLTKYIKKHYGSSVRIILSEQGYSSTWGQANQAAALAYSYYIAACNSMVDSFIIRSYYDHPVEVAQGLRMGIKGKEAFTVFKYMDTTKFNRYTKRYLKLIGGKSWKKLVPNYKKSRIYKMYTR
ncbi:hypothetical protein D3Z36_05310 [Lachnospiraceae bacterium]|nr:hypothetical protein [Lachnospiraceae bacterium]